MTLKILFIVACVLVIFTEQNQAITCKDIPGSLKQIDAGMGLVFGVNAKDEIFTLFGTTWVVVPGSLKHISVGSSGVWGIHKDNSIHKLVGGERWIKLPGRLTQLDAGGDQYVVGVNHKNNVFCMNQELSVDLSSPDSAVHWTKVPGALAYYSCGPTGCWGVTTANTIWLKEWSIPTECQGLVEWKKVSGSLKMIEVGTDGSVYGVNPGGDVYRRDGITDCDHAGTKWTKLSEVGKAKHVSYDLGFLWVITPEDKIRKCAV